MFPFILLKDLVLARSKTRRAAILNRQKDYLAINETPARLPLHRDLERLRATFALSDENYDYGEGYFYQGLEEIGITGLRNTSARVATMALAGHVAGKSILEVGCNVGFLSISLSSAARNVVGVDINPGLIEIARTIAVALGRDNLEFSASAFEDFRRDERFEVVLSFANHATFDGRTRQSLDAYFAKCAGHLTADGSMLFESHAPQFESRGLQEVVRIIEKHFFVEEKRVLQYGTALDRGRTFIVAHRRNG